ncbi:unnamed protein product, partial [Rotaria socialis]
INTQVDLHIKTIASSGVASAKPKKEDAWQFMGADVIHPVCRQDKPSIEYHLSDFKTKKIHL